MMTENEFLTTAWRAGRVKAVKHSDKGPQVCEGRALIRFGNGDERDRYFIHVDRIVARDNHAISEHLQCQSELVEVNFSSGYGVGVLDRVE